MHKMTWYGFLTADFLQGMDTCASPHAHDQHQKHPSSLASQEAHLPPCVTFEDCTAKLQCHPQSLLEELFLSVTCSLPVDLCTDIEVATQLQGHTPLHMCADNSISWAGSREGELDPYDTFDMLTRWRPCTDLAVALLDYGADISIKNHKASTCSSCAAIHQPCMQADGLQSRVSNAFAWQPACMRRQM